MRRRQFFTAAPLVLVSLRSRPGEAAPTINEQEIISLQDRLFASYIEERFSECIAHFDDELTFVSDSTVGSREWLERNLHQGWNYQSYNDWLPFQLNERQVVIKGNIAWAAAELRKPVNKEIGQKKGKSIGTVSQIFVKRESEIKIVHNHLSFSQPRRAT